MGRLLQPLTFSFWALLLGSVLGQAPKPLSVPNDPVVREQFDRVVEALRRDQRDLALELLQGALDGLAGKVVDVPSESTSAPRFLGARDHALTLIATLPGGLERYRELMEERATALLRSRVRSNEARLREVVRRFALTHAGRVAFLELIDLLLEQGRGREAIMTARAMRREISRYDKNPSLVAKSFVREAVALATLGNEGELGNLLAHLTEEQRAAIVTVDGRPTSVAAFIERLRSTTESGARAATGITLTTGVPFTHRFAKSEPDYRGRFADPSTDEVAFAVVPTVVDGVVYYSDGLALRARRLVDGKEVWPAVENGQWGFLGDPQLGLEYHVVVDRDLVYAYVEAGSLYERPFSRGRSSIPRHRLIAVDRDLGITRWTSDAPLDATSPDGRFVSGLNIAQPPLVVGDTLYVVGTTFNGSFQVWLCAFVRATGALRFKTYLGAGQTAVGRGGTPEKSAIPGHVVEHDGLLLFSTNLGVLAAVDAVHGAVAWQSPYTQRSVDPQFGGFGFGRGRRFVPDVAPQFFPSRPPVFLDTVLLAPMDSERILSVDVQSGDVRALAIPFGDSPNKGRYLLGVRGTCVIVGGPSLLGFDLVNSSVVFRHPEPMFGARGQSAQGRPALLEDQVVFTVPTGSGLLLSLDVRTGKYRELRPGTAPFLPGNVALFGDAIVIAGESLLQLR